VLFDEARVDEFADEVRDRGAVEAGRLGERCARERPVDVHESQQAAEVGLPDADGILHATTVRGFHDFVA